jgi:hypothetical protein
LLLVPSGFRILIGGEDRGDPKTASPIIPPPGLRVKGLGFRVKGLGLRVKGLGFGVWGLGFRV